MKRVTVKRHQNHVRIELTGHYPVELYLDSVDLGALEADGFEIVYKCRVCGRIHAHNEDECAADRREWEADVYNTQAAAMPGLF